MCGQEEQSPRLGSRTASSASDTVKLKPGDMSAMSTLVLAYGYVRLNRANGQRLEGLRRQIRAYCKREGLTLGLILADTDVSRTELRPGWTALLG